MYIYVHHHNIFESLRFRFKNIILAKLNIEIKLCNVMFFLYYLCFCPNQTWQWTALIGLYFCGVVLISSAHCEIGMHQNFGRRKLSTKKAIFGFGRKYATPPCPSMFRDQVSLLHSVFCNFASGSTSEDAQLRNDCSMFRSVCALCSRLSVPLHVCALCSVAHSTNAPHMYYSRSLEKSV